MAEVYKRACDGEQKSLLPAEDKTFEDLILQDFVIRVQVDFNVGVLARRLLRKYPKIKKPQDGVHLATALINDLDELHTYDRDDLLDLSEQIPRRDGKKLKICNPPKPPAPPKAAALPLWESAEKDENEHEGAKEVSGKKE